MNRWISYFVLLLTSQIFVGIQSSYSFVKVAIAEDLQISQQFFGILEMITMLSRFVIMMFLLMAPITRVKRTYFIFVVIGVMAFLVIMASHFLPSLKSVLLPIGMAMLGVSRGIYMFPYLLLYESFKEINSESNSNQAAFNIWFGLRFFGHAYAILLGNWMLYTLEYEWIVSLYTFTMAYLVSGVLTFLLVPESFLQSENSDQALTTKICSMLKIVKAYYKKNASNVILAAEFSFKDSQTSMIVFWIPYFFRESGFDSTSTWIALTYPVGAMVGSIIMNPLLKKCPEYAPIFTTFLLFGESLCFLGVILLDPVMSNLPFFIVLLASAYILQIAPFSRASSTEISERTETKRQNYLAINSMRMIRELVAAALLYVVGAVMEINIRYYLYVLLGTSVISLILHVVRRIVERSQRSEETTQIDQSNPNNPSSQSSSSKEVKPSTESEPEVGSQKNIVVEDLE